MNTFQIITQLAFSWLKQYRWVILIVSFLASSLGSSYLTAQWKDGQAALREQESNERYLKDLQKRQEEYNKKVEELNNAALQKQQELAALNTELERKHKDAERKAADINNKYTKLLRDGWRLRDNNAKATATKPVPNTTNGDSSRTPNSSDGTASGAELSREASEFLLTLTYDADRVVEQLRIAQEYAKALRAQCMK